MSKILEEDMAFFACQEHIDMAIDEFIVDFERAPQIEKCDEIKEKCIFCDKYADYKVY